MFPTLLRLLPTSIRYFVASLISVSLLSGHLCAGIIQEHFAAGTQVSNIGPISQISQSYSSDFGGGGRFA